MVRSKLSVYFFITSDKNGRDMYSLMITPDLRMANFILEQAREDAEFNQSYKFRLHTGLEIGQDYSAKRLRDICERSSGILSRLNLGEKISSSTIMSLILRD